MRKLKEFCKRAFMLLALGWITIFLYEAVRQVFQVGDIADFGDHALPGRLLHMLHNPNDSKNSLVIIQPDRNYSHISIPSYSLKPFGDFQRALDILQYSSYDCDNVTRPVAKTPDTYNVWYSFKLPPVYEIYVYSVYYDERVDNGIFPSLRILNVGRTLYNNKTFCQIWYPELRVPYIVEALVKKNGGGHIIDKKKYEQYYFTCSLPTSYPIPSHVSLVSTPCDQASNYIPIYIPIRTPPAHDFGICVPVAFKYVDPYRLVEWVEANRLLGVTEINVYHVNMANESLYVLRHYEKEGFVKLWPIPSVPRYVDTRDGNKIGSAISLNDCMYRNTYRYRWMLNIDFDELIVPRLDSDYSSMLSRIDKEEKLARPPPSYTLRNAYFWTGCDKITATTPEKAIILRHSYREVPSKFLYAAKSIIDPRRCISVFNHYCYHRFPMKDKEKWTIDVKTKFALSHHYRAVYKGRKGSDCNTIIKKTAMDHVMDRFSKDLKLQYESSLEKLRLR